MSTEEYVLGVDEHTGLVIDLEHETAQVVGNSTVTLRKGSRQKIYATGATFPLQELRSPSFSGGASSKSPGATHSTTPSDIQRTASGATTTTSLMSSAESRRESFDQALSRGDADAAIEAVLSLESDIRAWSADTLQSDERERAVAILRSMISRLGEIAISGLREPRSVVAPFVEGLLAIRKVVRAEKRFDLSDVVRDSLLQAGIEVRDTKDGVEWVLKPQT